MVRWVHKRIGLASAACLLVSVSASACGDDASAGGAAGGGGSAGTGGAVCPAGQVCLDVDRQGEPQPGIFAAIWFRVEGSIAYDPTVGYAAPFDVGADVVTFSLADVAPPPDVDLLCERPCPEVSMCACSGEFRASVAYLLVVRDADQSGDLSATEIAQPANVVGISNGALVWSDRAWAPAPPPWDATFPEGVLDGTTANDVSGSTFAPAGAGARFGLKVGPSVF